MVHKCRFREPGGLVSAALYGNDILVCHAYKNGSGQKEALHSTFTSGWSLRDFRPIEPPLSPISDLSWLVCGSVLLSLISVLREQTVEC